MKTTTSVCRACSVGAEDIWSSFGIVLLMLAPFVMLILLGIVAGILVLLRRRAQKKEERSKIACVNCGELIYNSAVQCFACKTSVESPHAVGVFGTSLDEPAPDPAGHPYKLVQKKRCPVCATRFDKRTLHQTCRACSHELFADKVFAEAYITRLDAHLPIVLMICACFSLIPVIGLIPGVIYYRLTLIGPLRRYIPRTRAILLRWLVRIAIFLLIMLQWIPVAGVLAVPLMALLNYGVYRSAFRGMLRSA